jgi:hypothetical protein
VTSEISSSPKEMALSGAVTAGSIPATDSVAVADMDSPATPKPAALKTDKAFLDRLPLEGCFIRDIILPLHMTKAVKFKSTYALNIAAPL